MPNLKATIKRSAFVDKTQDSLSTVKSLHAEMLARLRELARKIKAEEFSVEESVDIGFLLRECEIHLDELRKDFKSHKEAISKQTCYRLSLLDQDKCRGELATGSLKVSHYSKLPHPEHESEKFYKLCEFFGIDPTNIPLGSVRFHWPTMKKWVSSQIENGVELPEELSNVEAELEMAYRRRVSKQD